MAVMESLSRVVRTTLDQRERVLETVWLRAAESSPAARGESPRRQIEELVEGAAEMLVIATSELADPAITARLMEATARGVRIYLLIPKAPAGGSRELLKSPLVTARSVRDLGFELIIADPARAGSAGLLLPSPLATGGLDRPAPAFALTRAMTSEAFGVLRHVFWERAEQELLAGGKTLPLQPEGLADLPDGRTILHRLEDPALPDSATTALVSEANESLAIELESYGAGRLHEALLDAAGRGLEIRVLTSPRRSSTAALRVLARAGVEVFGTDTARGLQLVADGVRGLAGAVEGSADQGRAAPITLAIRLTGEQALERDQRLEQRTQAATWKLSVDRRLKDLLGPVMVPEPGGLARHEVRERDTVTLPDITAASVDRIDDQLELELETADKTPAPLAHTVELEAKVHAPRLSRKARPEKQFRRKKHKAFVRDSGLKVYRETDGRQVIAIPDLEALEAATRLKDQLDADAIVLTPSS